MNIIGKAFNPTQGDARAICMETDGYVIGLITKGEDSEKTVASFENTVANIDENEWDKAAKIWKSIETDSPVIMFCRNKRSDDSAMWKRIFCKNVKKEHDNTDVMEASMTGTYTYTMLIAKELYSPFEFITKTGSESSYGQSLILLSTAPYNKEKNWEELKKTILDAYTPLCSENPEEHWNEAGKVLQDALGHENAFVIITDAEDCIRRMHWNVAEGEPTEHKLEIKWSKEGFGGLYGPDYDEHTTEIVQAKTGALSKYEEFESLCITEITDSAITFIIKGEKKILTPGKTLYFTEHDGYESHDGIEYKSITYDLSITWL